MSVIWDWYQSRLMHGQYHGIFAGYRGGAVLTSRQLNESEFLPQPDRDRPLGEARNDLAGRLRPSGPDGEIDEWSI